MTMDGEDLSWLLLGAGIAWLLLRKPCPCEANKQTIAVGEGAAAAPSSGGGCVGGLPTCG